MLSLNRYRLVDFATQGYILLVALVMLALRGDHWRELLGLHLVGLLAVHCLIQLNPASNGPRWRQLLRDFYPILFYGGFYFEILIVNRMLPFPRLDSWLLRAEHAVFGRQVAEAFQPAFPQPFVSELLYLSYLSFYAMVGGVGACLVVRNRPAFGHFVTVVSLVFYTCYAAYLFVPAAGPRVLYADTPERAQFFTMYGRAPHPVPASVEKGWCYRALDLIERHAEIPGAAFPSSHVAMALTTAWFSWRYVRCVRWLHLLMALLICVSTVYTRAHYGVDVLGGLLAAGLLFPAAEMAYRRWGWTERAQPSSRA